MQSGFEQLLLPILSTQRPLLSLSLSLSVRPSVCLFVCLLVFINSQYAYIFLWMFMMEGVNTGDHVYVGFFARLHEYVCISVDITCV